MLSLDNTPASPHRTAANAEVLPRVLIALFLAIFLLDIVSPDVISSAAIRQGARWVAFIGLLLALIIVRMLRIGGGGFRKVELLVLGFLIVALIATLKNGHAVSGGLATLAGFVAMYLMAFHLTTSSRPAQAISWWTWSLLAVLAAEIVVSLFFTVRSSAAFHGSRFQGVTRNPNTLGAFAAVLMAGAIARALEKGASYRFVWIFLALLGGVCLFLTQSRTAFFAAAAGLTVVTLLRGNWMFLLVVVLLTALYMGAKSFMTSASPGNSVVMDVEVREVGLETRTEVWMEQLTIWLREPWLGNGMQVDLASGMGRKHGEGAYLELLSCVGILGTVPLLLFWLIASARLARWARRIETGREQHQAGYHLAAVGIVFTLLVHSIGEGYLAGLYEAEVITFWMILGAVSQLRWMMPRTSETNHFALRKRLLESVSAPT